MAELPAFQRVQYAFTAHIRNPDRAARPPDVEERRMAVYRDLLFNNVNGFLKRGFPVLRSLYDDAHWETRLARPFFARHRCRSPLFVDIPREFLGFLQDEFKPQSGDPPFLLELAHYEWVELALMVQDDTPDCDHIDRHGDLLRGVPVLTPLCWNLGYTWPVHRISATFQPELPPGTPTHLLVYRDEEDSVRFMEANPVTARLVQLIEEDGASTGQRLLEQIARELAHPNPDRVIEGGLQILTRLHHAHIILGTRRER